MRPSSHRFNTLERHDSLRKGGDMARVGGSLMQALWDWLLQRGPATEHDLSGSLQLSRTETYQAVRKAADQGLIKAVAPVHTDDKHRNLAGEHDPPDQEHPSTRPEQRG